MKPEPARSVDEPTKELGSWQQEARTCPGCGTKFFATSDSEFCLVCILQGAGANSGESSATQESGSISGLTDSLRDKEGTSQPRRFEHYEVMLDEAGRPIELGCGTMDVSNKALDVELRCPVTLKVINERYLNDESARLRFLRERVPQPAWATRTLPRSYTWAEPRAVIFTRWSSSTERFRPSWVGRSVALFRNLQKSMVKSMLSAMIALRPRPA